MPIKGPDVYIQTALKVVRVHAFGSSRTGAIGHQVPAGFEKANPALQTLAVDLDMVRVLDQVDVPEADTLTEGKSFFNEAWQANGRYIYLGAGKLDGKISCVLRCTNQPPPVTKPAPPPGP